MAYSTQRVTSDGSLVLLSVSMGYLERDHIHVMFNNVEDALPWAWVGPTSNQISFTPAVPNGVEVLVARVTDMSAPYHVFSQGAQFTAESLDEDVEQILYIAQEAVEQASTGEYYQDINMHGFQVYNLGVTSDPTAAVSLGQYQADALGANVAKVAAQSSQAAALVSQNAAAASEAAAGLANIEAAYHAAAALMSSNNAAASEINAWASADSARTSYDSFDDRYLGAKAYEPAVDNDGAALLTGALFFHTGVGLKVWNGSMWVASSGGTAGLTGFTPAGNLASTNVQAALQELDTEKLAVNGPASSVAFVPTGSLTSGNVQDAIQTLDSIKAPWSVAVCPAFIATINHQPVNAAVIVLTATEWADTNNCFANNKFTPDVAGLYQVNLSLVNNAADNWCGAYILRNGVEVASQVVPGLPAAFGGAARPSVSALVQMNGTTDYIQAAGFNSISGYSIVRGHFSGAFVRVV